MNASINWRRRVLGVLAILAAGMGTACVGHQHGTSTGFTVLETREQTIRKHFLAVIDRPRVALDAQSAPMAGRGAAAAGLEQFAFSYATEAGMRVPGILVKLPGDEKRPVIISLHGTGGSKNDQLAYIRDAARAGFIGIAIDGRWHGARTAGAPTEQGLNAYETAIVHAWRDGKTHPLYFDTAWDIMRLVDYLQTRPDVDASRIGVMGISKGGIEAYLAAAADPRIAAAAPLIAVQGFKWGLEHHAWQGRVATFQKSFDVIAREGGGDRSPEFVGKFYEKLMPGMTSEFDGPSIVGLIAPRPLLMVNGDRDPNTPLGGVQESVTAVRKSYASAGREDQMEFRLQENTPHQVRPESLRYTLEWFTKVLKAGPAKM